MGLFSKSSKASSTPPAPQEAPPPYTSTPQQQPQQQQYAPPPPPSAPQNPDTRQLSQGWITQFDPSSGRWFYVYTPMGHRQWEHPADRPLGATPPPPPQQQYGAPYGGYPQQPYGGYPQQPYGGYQPYPQQQPQMMMGNQRRAGGGMNPMMAAGLGLGAGVLGFAAADAIFDDNDGGGFDGGGDFGDF